LIAARFASCNLANLAPAQFAMAFNGFQLQNSKESTRK